MSTGVGPRKHAGVSAARSGGTWGRWAMVAGVLLAAVLAYRWFDLGQWLTLDQLKASRDALIALHEQRPLATVAAYFVVYVLFTALSVPGAAILTPSGCTGRWVVHETVRKAYVTISD